MQQAIRTLFGVVLAFLGCLTLAAQPAFERSMTQEQALAFQSPALPAARQTIDALIAELDPLQPVDWSLRIRPSALYREYLEGKPNASVTPRATVILQLRFSEKPVAAVRRLLKLERALAAYDRAERTGIRSALLAHGELLLQQQAAEQAEIALAGLQASRNPASASAAEQLQLDTALLTLQQTQHALNLARVNASEHGLSSEAVYASLRFRLPDPALLDPDTASANRILELQVLEAETLLEQAVTLDPVSDLRVGASYRNSSADLDFEGGWLAGRPGMRLALATPGGRERFEVRASIELVIDQKLGGLSDLQHDIASARAELLDFPQRHELEVAAAHADAVFAEESLRLAEAALSLAKTQRQHAQLSTRVWRAWLVYVRRTAELLELAGESWEIR